MWTTRDWRLQQVLVFMVTMSLILGMGGVAMALPEAVFTSGVVQKDQRQTSRIPMVKRNTQTTRTIAHNNNALDSLWPITDALPKVVFSVVHILLFNCVHLKEVDSLITLLKGNFFFKN